jgi:hypothetical protein
MAAAIQTCGLKTRAGGLPEFVGACTFDQPGFACSSVIVSARKAPCGPIKSTSTRRSLRGLTARGLSGVAPVIGDDHVG